MREVKLFYEFVKRGIAKKVRPDFKRGISFKAKAEKKNKLMQERLEKLGLTDESAEDYIESCYDIIMLLIRAKMYIDGYQSVGFGAHEAEVSYLRNLGFPEHDVQIADELRYFRNGMLYYATTLDKEYAQKVLSFLDQVYPQLVKIAEK